MAEPDGYNAFKHIPARYEGVIREALSHYPELQPVHINFKLADKYPVPYGTSPDLITIFRPRQKRAYTVTILEKADGPLEKALFKNLPREAQLGVLGHELGHVLQFCKKSRKELLKIALRYGDFYEKREVERDADIKAIEHGLGRELHMLAIYIRNIKGYVEQRKEIDTNYLKPHEILQGLTQKEQGAGV